MQKEAIGNADRFLPLKPSSATNNSSFVSVCYLSDQVVGADDVVFAQHSEKYDNFILKLMNIDGLSEDLRGNNELSPRGASGPEG